MKLPKQQHKISIKAHQHRRSKESFLLNHISSIDFCVGSLDFLSLSPNELLTPGWLRHYLMYYCRRTVMALYCRAGKASHSTDWVLHLYGSEWICFSNGLIFFFYSLWRCACNCRDGTFIVLEELKLGPLIKFGDFFGLHKTGASNPANTFWLVFN